ncbi:MAG: hypothetical protein J6A94_06265, partial [Lachnospiraceae bacterium]|nr:hypothetical protein [Lachnospiraceae bacterium]
MMNKKRMKKEKKKNLIFANIGRVLCKLGSTVKSSAVRTKDKLSLKVNNTDNYGYVGLGPTDDAENSFEYMRAMEWCKRQVLSSKKWQLISSIFGQLSTSILFTPTDCS